ncbi:ABC transporter permease [Actinobacteria bacterium YIM 96077]|uniref:ABC transporter permease n=1 Tax=Phytoactinopolyspora halophila TaxID=1981511 RepID=A0A329QC67_9ACTN|nr:ABC transporter permease [Phytoactinopolyspora halophila]AYY14129.1 ABC transporter permease [Actinobacteria bacterium YIM 96077]RAW09995.1 ABC transporter permease [Phytoactinopolyspora halophila]
MSQTTETVDVAQQRSRSRWNLGPTELVFVALVGIVIIGAVLVGLRGQNLFNTANTVDMFTRSSLLGFIAIGQTFAILCRSLDLSVGYVVALTSIVAATTMEGDTGRIGLGIGAVLLVSGAIGLANGLIIAVLRVNPFITTLGMGLIIKGYLDTQYQGPAGSVPTQFQQFGFTRLGFLPLSTAVMLAVALAGFLFLRKSRTGYHMFAVGGNAEVARMSGIRTGRVMVTAHVLCSLCAGLAGLLIAARFGTGSALVYDNLYELDSIAAVVLGGTLLLGGRGGIAGTIGGVLILAVLDTVFNILQVDPFFKDVLRGVIIIAAVAIYARRQLDRKARRIRFDDGNGGSATSDAAPKVPPSAGSSGRQPPPPAGVRGAPGDAHETSQTGTTIRQGPKGEGR